MVRVRAQFRWRADCDYIAKLSADDKAYITKFIEEYYGERFEADSLHDSEQKRELMRERNRQKLDIVTATPRALQKRRDEIAKMQKPRQYYCWEDYNYGFGGDVRNEREDRDND